VTSSTPRIPRRLFSRPAWLVGLFVLVALGLLVTGLFRYLPFVLNTDEATVVNRALSMGRLGPNPRWFGYPSLSFYLLALAYGVYFALAYAAGVVHSVQDCVALYACRPGPLYVIARSLSALSIGITLALAYQIGRRAFSETAALCGCGLIALCPMLVDNGSIVRIENYQLPFLAAAILSSLKIAESGARRQYILAGLLAGLATSVKYPGVLVLAPLAVAHAAHMRRQGRRWYVALASKRLWLALAFAALGFVLTTPYAVVEHRLFVADLANVRSVAAGSTGFSAEGSFWLRLAGDTGYRSLLVLLAGGMGAPAAVLGIVGLLWAASRTPRSLIVAAFPLAFIGFVGWYEGVREYWLVAIVPFALIAGAGWLVDGVGSSLRRHTSVRIAWVVVASVVGFLAVWSGYDAVRIAVERGYPDTRVLAHDWFVSHVAPGSSVLLDYGRYLPRGGVPLPETPSSVARRLPRKEPVRLRALAPALSEYYATQGRCESGGYELYTVINDPWLGKGPDGFVEKPASLDAYRAGGVKFAILLSSIVEFYEDPEVRTQSPEYVRPYLTLYESVRRQGRLIRRFSATPWRVQGPTVEIYEFGRQTGS
jgi:hypothetical protein